MERWFGEVLVLLSGLLVMTLANEIYSLNFQLFHSSPEGVPIAIG
jgi:hypothetical protein